ARVDSPNSLTNVARINHADQFDPDTSNNSSSATETPPRADLVVTKAVDNPTPVVTQFVTFTVTLTNRGPDLATNVSLTDHIPTGLSNVSFSASQGTYNPGTGVWDLGTVDPRTTQTLAIRAKVTSLLPQPNTATVSHSDQFDPDLANNTGSAIVLPQPARPSLRLVKLTNGTNNVSGIGPLLIVGNPVTWTYQVSNTGNVPLTGVTVADNQPGAS